MREPSFSALPFAEAAPCTYLLWRTYQPQQQIAGANCRTSNEQANLQNRRMEEVSTLTTDLS
jgi:hypothetical protein